MKREMSTSVYGKSAKLKKKMWFVAKKIVAKKIVAKKIVAKKIVAKEKTFCPFFFIVAKNDCCRRKQKFFSQSILNVLAKFF